MVNTAESLKLNFDCQPSCDYYRLIHNAMWSTQCHVIYTVPCDLCDLHNAMWSTLNENQAHFYLSEALERRGDEKSGCPLALPVGWGTQLIAKTHWIFSQCTCYKHGWPWSWIFSFGNADLWTRKIVEKLEIYSGELDRPNKQCLWEKMNKKVMHWRAR